MHNSCKYSAYSHWQPAAYWEILHTWWHYGLQNLQKIQKICISPCIYFALLYNVNLTEHHAHFPFLHLFMAVEVKYPLNIPRTGFSLKLWLCKQVLVEHCSPCNEKPNTSEGIGCTFSSFLTTNNECPWKLPSTTYCHSFQFSGPTCSVLPQLRLFCLRMASSFHSTDTGQIRDRSCTS